MVMGGLSETNCIRQPKGQLPSSSYNHNSLITSVLLSPGYMFLTATLKCICNDSFTDVLRLSVYCVSLSATIVTTLWLKTEEAGCDHVIPTIH